MTLWKRSRRLCLSLAAAVALAGTFAIASTGSAYANHNSYRYDRWSSSSCDDCGSYYAPTYRRSRGYYDDYYCDRPRYRRSYHSRYRDPYYDSYRYRDSYSGDRYYSDPYYRSGYYRY